MKLGCLLILLCAFAHSTVKAATPPPADNRAWLVGIWALQFDPDGVKKDWLEFLPDGTYISINAACSTLTGSYRVLDDQVQMSFGLDEKAPVVSARPAADRTELQYTSQRTGNVSVYRRAKGTACQATQPYTGCGTNYPGYFPCLPGGQVLASPQGELIPGVRVSAMLNYAEPAAELSQRLVQVAVDSGWTHMGTWEGSEPDGTRYRSRFTRFGQSIHVAIYPDAHGTLVQVMTLDN